MKNVIKQILSKIPLFLFCILFIAGYGALFGTENNIIGVGILTSILIFLKNDLMFQVKEASIAIMAAFILISFGPQLAATSPIVGLFVNLGCISFLLLMSSHDLSQGNHVPFLLTYIFCQGYPVHGNLYHKRVLSLIIGGFLVSLIYYAAHKNTKHKRNCFDLIKELNVESTRTKWYIKMSIALTFAMFLGDILNYSKTMWVTFTILSLLQPLKEDAAVRTYRRIPAAFLGSLVFFLIFHYVIPQEHMTNVALLTGFIAMFTETYFTKTALNSFNALFTACTVLTPCHAFALRVFSNIVGTIYSFLFDHAFTWSYKVLKPDSNYNN